MEREARWKSNFVWDLKVNDYIMLVQVISAEIKYPT